jgi:hypothetical protein
VYALNNPQRNVGCRNTWFLTFLHIAIWVFYVDTNTMELNCDKISTCSKMIFEKEKLTWEVFKLTLGVEHMERLVKNLKYSMDNERKNG